MISSNKTPLFFLKLLYKCELILPKDTCLRNDSNYLKARFTNKGTDEIKLCTAGHSQI